MENKTVPVDGYALHKKNLLLSTVQGVFLGGLSAVVGVPIIETAIYSNKTFRRWFDLTPERKDKHLLRDAAVIGTGYSVINGYLSFRDAVKYNKELEAIELERNRTR